VVVSHTGCALDALSTRIHSVALSEGAEQARITGRMWMPTAEYVMPILWTFLCARSRTRICVWWWWATVVGELPRRYYMTKDRWLLLILLRLCRFKACLVQAPNRLSTIA